MRIFKKAQSRLFFMICLSATISQASLAQTDQDAIMMSKNYFCGGAMYGYSSWKNYWEGTFKRDNQNLGNVSTQMAGVMGIYGIKNNFNVLFNLPYIQTKASEGTLHGMKGIQDLSLWLKWMPISKSVGKGTLSVFGLGGIALPVSDYTPDFLPMSIGLHSTNVSARVTLDYELGKFFITGSGTYTYRNNVKLDRNSYYTTELHLTNEVEMPDVASYNFRAGYRSGHLIAESFLSGMNTLGGFDIRKNDMPFASNKMNTTIAGIGFKNTLKSLHQLTFVDDAAYTLADRNVSQATSISGGVLYAYNVKGSGKKSANEIKINNLS
ncbi:MAG TPA: hypothetical protein PLA68_12155, partial [Panacibacter sp.]|nr:hypothetical protein [Panacibacter sp.]